MTRTPLLAISVATSISAGCDADGPELAATAQELTPFTTSDRAGSLAGSFDVSQAGAGGYTIPIAAPAWRGGVQPSLALRYSSDVGNGWLGVGWTIDGLSQITRCGQTLARDGEPRAVTLTTSDKLCLDGERLVPIDGTNLATTTTYRTSPDSFVRVAVTARAADQTPTAFRVSLKNGRIRTYGGSPDHRLEAKPRVLNPDGSLNSLGSRRTLTWLVASEEDRSGNMYSVAYTKLQAGGLEHQLEYVPSKITYGNRTIELTFCGQAINDDGTCGPDPRPDAMERWTGGIQTWMTRRLMRISISAPEIAGSTTTKVFRRYELSYSTSPATRRSLLAGVSLCDGPPGSSTCMEPTRFAYSGIAPAFEPSQTIANAGFSNADAAAGSVHVIDVTGDGLEDVVYRDGVTHRWYLRKGLRAAPWLGAPIEQTNLPTWCGDCVSRAIDINRDGYGDLMLETLIADTELPSNRPRFHLGGPNGLGPVDPAFDLPEIPQPAQSPDPDAPPRVNRLDPKVTFADMTGDGLPEVFYRAALSPSAFGNIQAYRWTRSGGWADHALFVFPASGADRDEWELADLDADGRSEILYTHAGGYGPRRAVTRKPTAGPAQVVEETLPDFVTGDPCNAFVDANGDGLLDLVNVRGGLTLRMNEGAFRFGPPRSVASNLPFSGVGCEIYSGAQELTPDRGVRAADLDGDGKQDLIVFWTNDGRTTVQWYRSAEIFATENVQTGTKTLAPTLSGSLLPMPLKLGSGVFGAAAAQLADLNGDGRIDLIQSNGTLQIDIQRGPVPDLLTSATNGIGLVHAAEYEHLATSSSYTRCTPSSASYPVMCVWNPGVAVVREKLDDGSGPRTIATHQYTGRLVDAAGDGDLGFAKHAVIDVRVANKPSTTTSELSPLRTGDPEGIGYYTVSAPARVTTSTFDAITNRWHFTRQTLAKSDKSSFDARTRVIWTSSSRTESMSGTTNNPDASSTEPATWSATTVDVDGYGNPTTQIERRGSLTTAWTTTTTTSKYGQESPASWLIGRPTFVKVDSTSWNSHATVFQSQSRTTALRYDPVTGNLTRTVREPTSEDVIDSGPDAALYLDTTITPDAFGQPRLTRQTRKQLDALDTAGLVRTSEVEYDADGVHVVKTKPALEHLVAGVPLETSRIVDPGRGVATRETDLDGFHTYTQYDRFGRMRRSELPDGKAIDISYTWDAAAKRLVVATSSNDGSGMVRRLDSLGRERTAEAKSFSGVALVDTTYDGADRVATVTEPHFATDTPNVRELAYDALGRQVSSCLRPNDGVSAPLCETMYYRPVYAAPPKIETTDASGRLSIAESDPGGRVVKTTIHASIRPGSCDAAANTDARSTTYAYGPFDLLATSKDAAANAVTLGYDRLGRRTALDDDDTGTRAFKYDGFDELREERDATGRITRLEYDPLGRQTRRATTPIDFDGDARWTYDTAPGAGKGKIASMTNDAVARAFSYTGPAGALAYQSVSYLGITHFVRFSYDALGRVQDTTYPEAVGRGVFATRNVYSPNGHLSEIQIVEGPNGGSALWTALSADAGNRVRTQRVNAGRVTTSFTYHPFTRRATGIHTRDATNAIVQSSEFAHCKNGNLASRRDWLQNQLEKFEYDDANRLVTSRLGATTRTWSYDAVGNMTSTNEPGLAGCTWNYGEGTPGRHALTSLQCGASRFAFTYDANGNMTTSPAIPAVGSAARSVAWGTHKAAIVASGASSYRWIHDADGQRAVKVQTAGGSTTTEYVDGFFERRLNPDGSIDYVYLVSALGKTIGQYTWHWTGTAGTHDWRFLHYDVLGSPELTTNMNGNGVGERLAFDPWGKRRSPTWSSTTPATAPAGVKLGFTGHSHDDEIGVIDMSGRIYDPVLKRFLSTDPFVQAPYYGPSWNRYSYVFNNPLRYVDPSGYRASLQSANRMNGGVLAPPQPHEIGWGLLEGSFGIAKQRLVLYSDLPNASDFFSSWGGGEEEVDATGGYAGLAGLPAIGIAGVPLPVVVSALAAVRQGVAGKLDQSIQGLREAEAQTLAAAWPHAAAMQEAADAATKLQPALMVAGVATTAKVITTFLKGREGKLKVSEAGEAAAAVGALSLVIGTFDMAADKYEYHSKKIDKAIAQHRLITIQRSLLEREKARLHKEEIASRIAAHKEIHERLAFGASTWLRLKQTWPGFRKLDVRTRASILLGFNACSRCGAR